MTEKYPFYKYQLLLPNIYIPFSLMNSTTSCPLSAITTFINSKLIKLATSREWMWSYKPPNRARLNPNRRCAPLLPTLGGLQWRWHRSFSDEALKVVTQSLMAMIPILQNHYICFMCSHFKPSQWDLIKNCIHSSQDQKARNKLLGLEVEQNHQNLQNQVLLQYYHCKTNIGIHEWWSIFDWIHQNPSLIPYKYPLENPEGEKKRGKNGGKYWKRNSKCEGLRA